MELSRFGDKQVLDVLMAFQVDGDRVMPNFPVRTELLGLLQPCWACKRLPIVLVLKITVFIGRRCVSY